ncbi:MAG: META domain-containing protein [Cyanobacteria bacterium J06638_20]
MKPIVVILISGLTTIGMWPGKETAIALPLSTPPTIAQAADDLQGNWILAGWGNPDDLTAPLADTEITAQFEGDRLGGSSGCNNYVTSYAASNGTLSFDAIASTRRACPSPISNQETQYLMALSNVDAYSVEGDRLILSYETEDMTGVLVFERPAAIPGLW